MRLVPKFVRWMGLGALAAYLFDPERGRARRTELADRAAELKKKAGLESTPDHTADKVPGSSSTPSSATQTSAPVASPTANAATSPR